MALKIPLIGVMAAAMTVAMSFALVPIAYELHLTVLAGIVLGPLYGFIAGFIFMLLRWLMGDGAVTLIGVNSLLMGVEIALGYYLFRLLLRALAARAALSASVSAFVVLALTTVLFLGVVAAGNVNPFQGEMGELGAYDVETGTIQNPFDEGLVALHLFEGEHHDEHEEAPTIMGESPFLVYARAVLLLGLIGWILESVVVGLIVGFLARVRRDLVMPERGTDTG